MFCLVLYRYFVLFWNIYHKKNIHKAVNNCGPLGIKLIQFLVMRNVLKENKDFLENCNVHPFHETKRLYFKDFNKDITKDFIINSKCIGSGSIGQVYKLYDINLKKHVAVKCKHPEIDKNIEEFSNVLKWIIKIFYFWKWNYVIIEFLNNMNTQLNYRLEAENTKKLKNKFKDENVIRVPEIYNVSDNFIVMEYLPGKSFEEIDNQVMISLYIQYFFMSSVLCYDFIHGDLHFGNWKISKDNKIIVYDCSLMYESGNLDFNKKIMEFVFNGNYKNLLNYINKDKKDLIDKVIQEIDNLDNETAGNRIQNFLLKSMEHKLISNKYVINLLNAVALIGETEKLSIDIYTKYIFTKGDSNAIMFYTHIDLLNKIGIFNDLKVFFENWNLEDPQNKITHQEWLMENFGHTDSYVISDIIYEKLKGE
jgi:predicted unusual protein kinase regulating ubiquinone biosynthesis (AarF/ABC1/UbiB family)